MFDMEEWVVVEDAGSRSFLLATPGIPRDLAAVPDLVVAGRVLDESGLVLFSAPNGEEREFLIRYGKAIEVELQVNA